jgi:hypothetical protein
MASTALWSPAAFANAGATDGGGGVTVGVSTPSTPSGSSGGSGPGGSGTGSGPVCTYTPVDLSAEAGFGVPPGGPTPGSWYLVQCPGLPGQSVSIEWIPAKGNVPPPPVTANAGALAAEAAASIVLPAPEIVTSPTTFSIVNLPTWLAVNPVMWHSYQATASVGAVTATAVATPVAVTWIMGDGGVVHCGGPGTLYEPDLPAGGQSSTCSYSYGRTSDEEPATDGDPNDGAFVVTAQVQWNVTWTASGDAGGGTLPSLTTRSTEAVRVEQVESVGISP